MPENALVDKALGQAALHDDSMNGSGQPCIAAVYVRNCDHSNCHTTLSVGNVNELDRNEGNGQTLLKKLACKSVCKSHHFQHQFLPATKKINLKKQCSNNLHGQLLRCLLVNTGRC